MSSTPQKQPPARTATSVCFPAATAAWLLSCSFMLALLVEHSLHNKQILRYKQILRSARVPRAFQKQILRSARVPRASLRMTWPPRLILPSLLLCPSSVTAPVILSAGGAKDLLFTMPHA